mmetsp:Transcript_40403/g.75666  ORF Transcript_40403/g.75666 Transcript_40403/m.75666 type:complete len:721 (-) Transcript_40403:241-2403(-)
MGVSSPAFIAFNFVPEAVVELEAGTGKIIEVNETFEKELAPFKRVEGLSLVNDLVQHADRPRVVKTMADVMEGTVEAPEPEGEGGLGENENPWGVVKEKSTNHAVNTLVMGLECQYPIYRSYDWVFVKNGERLYGFGRLITPMTTARHSAERELMDFFDNAPIAMHWLGGTGTVLWANKREMNLLGYSPEEYIGKPIMNFCPDDEKLVLKIFHQLGTGNTISDVPVRFRTKDGRLKHLLIDSNVNWNADGSFHHTRCFIRDDTGRQIREAQMAMAKEKEERAHKQKEALLRKLLHEIKTPCNEINLSADMLTSNGQDVELSARATKLLRASSMRLSDVLHDVADVVMFQAGSVPKLPASPFVLKPLLQQVVDHLMEAYTKKHIPVHVMSNLDNKTVVGNARCIERVVRHLTKNSLSAIKEGSIILRAMLMPGTKDQILIAVRDTAGGVDVDEMHKLMANPWKDTDNKMDADGLGLGLHICNTITQVLGSELKVESAKGVSTFSFQVTMPVSDTPPPAPEPAPAANAKDSPGVSRNQSLDIHVSSSGTESESDSAYQPAYMSALGSQTFVDSSSTSGESETEQESMEVGLACELKLHALVVEDNIISQMCVNKALEDMGMIADGAENGQEALDKLNAHPGGYDVIIMDLRMPVMDGLTCTGHIRKDMKLTTPIIAFTAEYSMEIKEQCFELGMNGFLSKPVNKDEMRGAIEKVLNRKLKAK